MIRGVKLLLGDRLAELTGHRQEGLVEEILHRASRERTRPLASSSEICQASGRSNDHP